MLNIPSTIQDPNYRYRMPKMQLKIQSKGNGIKTNIVNLSDVAKYLRTDSQYILKFFGFERASQTTFKQAGGKNNTNYIINGEFTDQQMLKTLDKYIEKYVCCPKCKLPQMHLIVPNGIVSGKCDSCPFTGELDNKHRLTAFILKNPPVLKNMATGQKQKQVKNTKVETVQIKDTKKKIVEKKEDTCAKELFDVNTLEFGSQELQKLVEYVRNFIDEKKEQDFDIKSAYIVSELKPLGLKKPLLAYVIFNSLFTVNIAGKIQENSRLYLNLMKKLVVLNTQLETLLNLQYMFLQVNKSSDYSKFLPTIMMKMFEAGFFKEEFISQWASQKGLQDIQKAFMYSAPRDEEFKKLVKDFIDWATEEEQEEEQEQINQEKQATQPETKEVPLTSQEVIQEAPREVTEAQS